VRVRREAVLHRALTTGLTEATKKGLDALLEVVPDTSTTRLSWLRNASQSPAPVNILGLIERIEFLRKLGVDVDPRQAIPAGAFDRIARDALKKITAQHLAETAAPRRHALLAAAALSLETRLTDATLLMFDKMMGSHSRNADDPRTMWGTCRQMLLSHTGGARTRMDLSNETCICNDDLLRTYIATQIIFLTRA
jgi:hypothetical protein